MKQRERYNIVISEDAKKRMREGKCPSCGKPKSKWNRRTDWRCCSVKCTAKFEKDKIIRSWPELRMKAFKRDNFTCVRCRKKPKRREMNSRKNKDGEWEYYWEEKDGPNDGELVGDHIIPIALGGDEWDLKNIQTLCINCNKIKTKQDAKKIAKQRRIEKKLIKGQKQLLK